MKLPITIADIYVTGWQYNLTREEIWSLHQSYLEGLDVYEALDYCNRNLVVMMYIFNIISKKDLRGHLKSLGG